MSYKVSKAIEVTYQAAGSATGLLDVQMDVYDEAHAIDAPKGGAMTEIGSTGRYYKAFTPDAEGEWTVLIDSATTPGKVVKHYSVVGHDVDSVGDAVAVTDGKVDAVDTVVDAIKVVTDTESGVKADVAALNDVSTGDIDARLSAYDAPTKAELDTAEAAIRGGSETLGTIKTAVDGIGSPPMVG
jgi:hypothetical protein